MDARTETAQNGRRRNSHSGETRASSVGEQRFPGVLDLQRLAGNAAVAALLQRQHEPGVPSATGYVGLNPQAGLEAGALGKKMGKGEKLVASTNDAALEGSLSTDVGIDSWVRSLGADPATQPAIALALKSADAQVRDQLAHLISMFWRAQKGEYRLERLVVSGHSNGVVLWGEASATQSGGMMILERDLQAVSDLFPAAAGQIEDVMFSACFSLGAVGICAKVFPNLQTCWAYQGFSPGASTGATSHIGAWAGATAGRGTLQKTNAKGSSALWTRADGFIVGNPGQADVATLQAQIEWRLEKAVAMREGWQDLDKAGLLDPLYVLVQQRLVHPDIDARAKQEFDGIRDWLLRLRFWDRVTKGFATDYSDQIKAAHAAVGVATPVIEGMTRAAAVAYYEEWGVRAADAGGDASASQDIVGYFDNYVSKGLYQLDPAVIPETWL